MTTYNRNTKFDSYHSLSVNNIVFCFIICMGSLFVVGDTSGQELKTLTTCQYDSDCVENAYCWAQQSCLCKEGYLVDKNRTHVQCLLIATQFGDPCTMDVQCRVTFTAQAKCRDGFCGCSEASHFQAGRCYESKRIGQICQVSNNCHIQDSPSYCVSGVCTCPFQHHPNADGTRCLRSSFLGDGCSGDEECVAQNSRCLDVCRCQVDHVISADQKRCLKAANAVGEQCEIDSQCKAFMSNAECREGQCFCVKNYHQRGPVCMRSVMLNHECSDSRQCVTPTHKDSNSSEITNVDCVDGTCVCTADYTATEDSLDCIRFSENGASGLDLASVGFVLISSVLSQLCSLRSVS
ncbi:prion-like-(Q/N-rich) domain-bearing protein 25 isoform X2 [Athalia rosae]|uniref:prion-like-(Q/N-rich) domain-bearing protein 25 isoform X2 n=1 Tax=Athalia rosae TaxID=37344 RepID=UPI0020346CAB|nr:prion-like-(Q/N-rich) domain-bearing protein 25 isoform X2 [Athalia rosae]